ncbi:pyruvate dehydrogenase E1 component subunit alpha [Fonticula alba]|uniref:Pyruvate dehydrogenase E1 component subunit alpha n=1 Tax=Fonticula alba TaxID=691883 RepID=A0A058ZA19_FONAL|nr:pyruvate dehydrogenase E1 component subunit alpha [Fonticula alba]KCV70778.1 pyruvate dehydrogenase E1 component subunit alpha [Fonticula alba]|eukprot:XP_009495294.1 pyruvate dehydrogenase E1 component subunit alpha [Fonticula alba]
MLSTATRLASRNLLSKPLASLAPRAGLATAASNDEKQIKVEFPDKWVVHKLDETQQPPSFAYTNRKELLDYFYEMTVVRRMEIAADTLYKSRMIRGFCHLANGQEAVSTGVEAALEKEDSIITSYRCHGFVYTRGEPVGTILAELMGREAGCTKGKGGSMHMFTNEFYGGNGIVGAQVPLGAGIAFAHKYNGRKNICLAAYGDGAANQGQVFEAFNIAKLWDIPAIFVCENNQYGMGTSAERSSASTTYYTRGDYVPGIRVNGMDVLQVREAVKWAKEYVLNHGPLVMEMMTYRYFGHSMSDPGTTYRSKEEVENIRRSRDPIAFVKGLLLENGLATEAELKELDNKARDEVEAGVAFAKASPETPPEHLFTDVYIKGHEVPYLRGRHTSETHYFQK